MVMRNLARILIPVMVLSVWVSEAWADRRVALVIGNGAYEHTTPLRNPLNDAKAIAEKFKAMGFDKVELVTNLDYRNMRRALQNFSTETRNADVAVVYYAGHGMEMGGTNYLIPVDAKLRTDQDVDFESLPLDLVMRVLEPARKMRLVILDACRNNPLANKMSVAKGASRSIGRGLARVEPAGETLIAYAAKAGSTAADGRGKNSPYTASLLQHMGTPGLEIRFVLGRVRDSVLKKTQNRQEPFVYGSLGGEQYFFVPPKNPVVPELVTQNQGNAKGGENLDKRQELVLQQQLSIELEFWNNIKNSKNPRAFKAYLDEFKNGRFRSLARLQIEQLGSSTFALNNSNTVTTDTSGAGNAALHQCDRLAAYVGDKDAPKGTGVTFRNLKGREAVKICERATSDFPNQARFKAYLARSYSKLGRRDTAFIWYRKAAEQGSVYAMVQVANQYRQGSGTARDLNEAFRWYRRAADRNDAYAMNEVAVAYATGKGITKNSAEAMRWYKKSANQGNATAMYNLARRYLYGSGTAKDPFEAKHWFERAANAKNTRAMRSLADMFLKGQGVAKDLSQGVRWMREAAVNGDTVAMTNMGDYYELGRGVRKDYAEAARWHQKAVDGGLARAMNNLALLYESGNGVRKDKTHAARLFLKAANAGSRVGMRNIGRYYEYGIGINKDYVEALRWYKKSASRNYASAMVRVGHMYNYGRGVRRDYVEAARWYRKAANLNHVDGYTNLGYFYAKGRGVQYNAKEAVRLYEKAANMGNAYALNYLGDSYRNGTLVARNQSRAISYYRRAAAKNYPAALFNLAYAYAKGNGVRRNESEAFRLYQRAANRGNASAMNNLGRAYSLGLGTQKNIPQAIQWYRKAVAKGNVTAMRNMGFRHFHGSGVTKDYQQAVSYFQKAISKNDLRSYAGIARVYQRGGFGVSRNQDRALDYVMQALRKGDRALEREIVGKSSSWTLQTRKGVQSRLKQAGYYSGAIDGVFGRGSKDSLRRYMNR